MYKSNTQTSEVDILDKHLCTVFVSCEYLEFCTWNYQEIFAYYLDLDIYIFYGLIKWSLPRSEWQC